MRIQNSYISMASTHHESSYTHKESMTIEAAKSKDAVAAILSLSQESEGKSVKEAMAEYQKHEKDAAEKQQKENQLRSFRNMADQIRTQRLSTPYDFDEYEDMQISLLRQILAILNGEEMPRHHNRCTDLRSEQFRNINSFSSSMNMASAVAINPGGISIGTDGSGTTWQKITAVNGFHSETETTTFATKGIVQTADGRNIGFNVELSMSRSFMQETNLLEVCDYIKTDPLMINIGTDIPSVSDQKFLFDLDADGKKEKISFAGKGSGFLALDKNGDGKINDGSELFGTKSGDGFKDLAAYDEDGNGWIDENDDVFNKLKVWTKDENGNDKLIDLKKADVGAIYLGHEETQFSLKDEYNRLNAEVKKSGIFLRESTGAVGTVNHVDLVV
ncbi:MAG: hypothetical protein K6E56_07145 [Lachnospiraceae bacterium]|nr:hypothetical protein [Lachnospiraceae bacterium]